MYIVIGIQNVKKKIEENKYLAINIINTVCMYQQL